MKRILFLFLLVFPLVTSSCIPTAVIVIAGWRHLTIQDEKQIEADKSDCEGKAIKVIEARKSEIQDKTETALKISAVDKIFQQEFSQCMKSKDYYKEDADDASLKSN